MSIMAMKSMARNTEIYFFEEMAAMAEA